MGMMFDPCLWTPGAPDCWVNELFKSGRLYLLRYPLPMSSPAETEALCAEFSGKILGILCTEQYLNTDRFGSYMSDMGAPRTRWSTISCSRMDALLFQIMVMKKKRPAVEGLLLDPPGASLMSFGRGATADNDTVLLLPDAPTIRQYFIGMGVSGSDFDELRSNIMPSSLNFE